MRSSKHLPLSPRTLSISASASPTTPTIELDEIGLRLKSYLEAGRAVYAICKHEETPAGALNAEKLFQASDGTLP